MSKKQTKQSRHTKWRKERQQLAREHRRLCEHAMNFEGMSATRVARMSRRELERVVASGKRRRMVTPFDGIAMAMAMASGSAFSTAKRSEGE